MDHESNVTPPALYEVFGAIAVVVFYVGVYKFLTSDSWTSRVLGRVLDRVLDWTLDSSVKATW
jgi:hypothetical protein